MQVPDPGMVQCNKKEHPLPAKKETGKFRRKKDKGKSELTWTGYGDKMRDRFSVPKRALITT